MTQGGPTAAPPMSRNSKGALCYPDHPNMAVVMAEEARQLQVAVERDYDRNRYERERRSARK